jgi:hypothetical protein
VGGQQRGSGSRRGFLERLRVQQREEAAEVRSHAQSTAARGSRSGRSRSRRRGGGTGMTKFQLISIVIMALLGFAVVGSTFLPYIGGSSGGGNPIG